MSFNHSNLQVTIQVVKMHVPRVTTLPPEGTRLRCASCTTSRLLHDHDHELDRKTADRFATLCNRLMQLPSSADTASSADAASFFCSLCFGPSQRVRYRNLQLGSAFGAATTKDRTATRALATFKDAALNFVTGEPFLCA